MELIYARIESSIILDPLEALTAMACRHLYNYVESKIDVMVKGDKHAPLLGKFIRPRSGRGDGRNPVPPTRSRVIPSSLIAGGCKVTKIDSQR
jgi:hypothetical protein